jgi:hypothetical protein
MTFSADSPTRAFGVTLNNDHTFSMVQVPEPGSVLGAVAVARMMVRRRRAV